MQKQGTVTVISGFSGAGKGTTIKRLMEIYNNYALSVSATSREPRNKERDGVEYHFKSREEFEKMIAEDRFIEYARYGKNYYGTPRDFVEEQMALGKDVLLEIEVQGAMQVKEKYPDIVMIFISAPSAKILKERLIGRGTEPIEIIEQRMNRAVEEADMMDDYDYIVINDNLEKCVQEVHNIIAQAKTRTCCNGEFISNMQKELKELQK